MPNIKPSNFRSVPRQAAKLDESRRSEPTEIECCGIKAVVLPGVYQTSLDTALMIESVEIGESETFLEIGCGTGIISLALGKKAKSGVGVDINDKAVENSKLNAEKLGIANVEFFKSDIFEKVPGKFDVIICNPPYTDHEVRDEVDRMFWDPGNEMKERFFREARSHLKAGGRIYFGWANFADIDTDLPLRLAAENNLKLINTFRRPNSRNEFTYFVFEFSV